MTPASPETSSLLGRVIRRMTLLDFQRERATQQERALLAASPTPITHPVAQDFAAWRHSLLWVAAGAALLNAVSQLVGFNPLAESVPAAARDAIGVANLALVDNASRALLIVLFIGTFLVAVAALTWRHPRGSGLLARIGWLVMFLTPLVLAGVPYTRLMDLSHLPEQAKEQVSTSLGAALALGVFFNVGPRAVALFPGIIRSSLAVKTLLPESSVPGWAVATIAPLYVVFLWVLVTGLLQTQASFFLLGGLACLTLSPLVFVLRRRALIRPQTPHDAARIVTTTKRIAGIFGTAGFILVAIFLLRRPQIDAFDLLAFISGVLSNVLLLTVVGADALLRVIRSAHEVSGAFHNSALAETLGDKLNALDPLEDRRRPSASVPPVG
jgi:hypothetical protein